MIELAVRSQGGGVGKSVEIQNPKQIIMKNKRPATKGTCPKCRTIVFRIGKA